MKEHLLVFAIVVVRSVRSAYGALRCVGAQKRLKPADDALGASTLLGVRLVFTARTWLLRIVQAFASAEVPRLALAAL